MSSKFQNDRNILDEVYLAASDPARWPEVLARVSDHIGAIGGMIAFNAPLHEQGFLITGRLDENLSQLYLERYTDNPWVLELVKIAARRPVHLNSLVDEMALRRTAFHADILAPQKIVDGVNWVEPSLLQRGRSGGFGFFIGQRAADRVAEPMRHLTPLLPHL